VFIVPADILVTPALSTNAVIGIAPYQQRAAVNLSFEAFRGHLALLFIQALLFISMLNGYWQWIGLAGYLYPTLPAKGQLTVVQTCCASSCNHRQF